MGIKGLLPYLSNSQRDVNVSSFRGQTVAIDAYCWLHKGAYSCALQLMTQSEKCDNLPFVRYCMKRINLLLGYDITPIVVFDGANLPAKGLTEKERRERRKSYLQKGKALLKDGRQSEAIDCFQRCIDISPEMAAAFIKELKKNSVQVVVAPYEADAQLAYLVKEGIAQLVITEDSDLLAFGCPQVLFKMTDKGDGKLIEFQSIAKATKSLVGFTPESFRHVCILSGCDYLQSIPGVGVATAVKLMRKHNKDPYSVIKGLKREKGKKVPSDYEERFTTADRTFLYQIVFDPREKVQVRLTTPTATPTPDDLTGIGMYNSPSKQVGLSRGNINPLTLEHMEGSSPSKVSAPKSSSWVTRGAPPTNRHYPIKRQQSIISVSYATRRQFKNPLLNKRGEEDGDTSDSELQAMYGTTSQPSLDSTPLSDATPLTIIQSKYFKTDPNSLIEEQEEGVATSPGGVVTIDISDSENNAVIQPVVRKRLSLESFEGHMSKRIKLSDNCHNETVTSDSSGRRLQVPAASNNGRLRLGLSRKIGSKSVNASATDNKSLLSYFCYKQKDKLSLKTKPLNEL